MNFMCDRCVLTEDKGVCEYCLFADSKIRERKLMVQDRPWVIYDIKKRAGEYDCLLGLSGGVDSSYALHKLLEEGLRPLTFTVDNGYQTDLAQENVMKLVEGAKVPYYRYTIDLDKFNDLLKAFIKSGVKNIEIPSDHLIYATSYEMADKYNIKTIVSGGNWQSEGTMPDYYGYNASDLTYIKDIAKKFGATTEGLPTMSLLKYLYLRNVKGIKKVNLLDHYEYRQAEAKKILAKEYGWVDYGEKHGESKLTKWFQNVYLPQVHGLDKRRPHLTSLIHSGQITKEQALAELKQPLPQSKLFELPQPSKQQFKTNQFWERKWVKFFNILKHYGYSR